MLRIALAVGLLASTEASAHCYSVWHYPTPQRCGVARQMVRRPVLHSVAASSVPNQERSKNKADTAKIALPSLVQADFDGGGADEPTRARLLLRAALEAANGH
jgi:hypothetical protein